MPKSSDTSGNSIKSEAELARRVFDIGEALWRLEGNLQRLGQRGVRVTRICVLPQSAGRDEALVIVTAESAEGKIVAFVNGEDAAAALKLAATKIENGSVKWRLDNDGKR